VDAFDGFVARVKRLSSLGENARSAQARGDRLDAVRALGMSDAA
jgi:hypothetical protein